ncbi:MAG: hypothetical protein N2049_11275 [Anaerolineales bacterium]|nr:hypothetical protein [Anaerolineales bacterium]MCX7609778.1 hypothetical protein [Anaerolineales bacterium]MDW8226254.1 hypothetical protein [Anaerolineales bacterium]
METRLQELSQLATLAGLLGGFGFTAVVELLSIERRSKILTATILTFSVATLLFLLALLIFILTFAAAVELEKLTETLETLGTYGLILSLNAVFVLEAGIGMAGWIRSKAAGIATTILSILTMCLTGIVIISILRHF